VGQRDRDGRLLEGVRILLVEDDPDTRDVLTLGLEVHGATVTAVSSAHQALHALAVGSFDVLLSDIGLPDEDGLALMRCLRRLPPAQGGRVPAAAVTAFTLVDDGDEAVRAGFQCHFRKPVDTRTLFRAVAELARQGRVERRRTPRAPVPPDGLAEAS
jgi:CheY-like chemotaxis protein